MDDAEFSFEPPPFNAGNALLQLQRDLRGLKLSARGDGFELRGKRVAELVLDGALIQARLARKLAMTPEWDCQTIATAADQRKWMDEMKKRLARWDREE